MTGPNELNCPISILQYEEKALKRGTDAAAIAYVKILIDDSPSIYGAGVNTDINMAAMKAVVSACNRAFNQK